MKPSTLLSALPLLLAASPALAQAPAPAAPAAVPAPAAAAPVAPAAASPEAAPVVVATPTPPTATIDSSVPLAPAPVMAPLPPPAPAEKTEDDAAAPPDKLTVAKTGYFQPGAAFQVWALGSHLAGDPENEWNSTFRVRRAEIKAKGEIIPKTFGYSVMFDVARLLDFQSRSSDVKDADGETVGTVSTSQPPSGGNTSILQDVALTWMTEYADVSLGQFKIPVSLEGAGSASKLYFPERALVSRRFGDRRDLGIKAEKKFDMFGYTLGLYNGEGANRLDSNDQKDLSLRLEVYPIKDVTAAVVGYTAIGDREDAGTKDRVEGDLKLERNNVLLQAEYIHAWDMVGTTRVRGQGFYVLAGYTLFDKLQPVVRIGSLDPDTDNDEQGAVEIDPNDEYTTYELGVNYYFKQHDAKLQLAGGFFDPEQESAHTRFDLILAAQISF